MLRPRLGSPAHNPGNLSTAATATAPPRREEEAGRKLGDGGEPRLSRQPWLPRLAGEVREGLAAPPRLSASRQALRSCGLGARCAAPQRLQKFPGGGGRHGGCGSGSSSVLGRGHRPGPGGRGADVDDTFTVWIKRCEETLNASQTEVQQPLPPKIKYDWYQTESQVIVTIMVKNAQKDDVSVHFSEKEMNASVRLPSGEDYNLKLVLLHSIVPEQSTFKVLSTKVEIKMKKPEAVRWEKLEGQGDSPKLKQFTPDSQHLYPSSSHYTRNWDKLVVEIKEEEKNEKLEGDAALNKLFQQIYSDGTDEVKRAMNKSFMESGGTVLSTNWSDVGKRKVEVNPPDDMEWKKF
uniref:Uncharacterized protein n=1 Tax=Melopsittacus undulatus TaxID=13146 RepID=A0A8V5FVM2_MELUD